eukprot:6368047-Amphidinium_carterae.1
MQLRLHIERVEVYEAPYVARNNTRGMALLQGLQPMDAVQEIASSTHNGPRQCVDFNFNTMPMYSLENGSTNREVRQC